MKCVRREANNRDTRKGGVACMEPPRAKPALPVFGFCTPGHFRTVLFLGQSPKNTHLCPTAPAWIVMPPVSFPLCPLQPAKGVRCSCTPRLHPKPHLSGSYSPFMRRRTHSRADRRERERCSLRRPNAAVMRRRVPLVRQKR